MIRDNMNDDTYDPMETGASFEPGEGLSESLFEILWRHRWTVLIVTLVALAAGGIYLHRATPLYTSTSRIYVEQAGPQLFERDASGAIARWSNYLYTQAELIQRTETLSTALSSPALGRPRTFAEVSNPVAALRQDLEVEVGKKDEIINVSFTSPYPEEAATIVNCVVDTYITSHNERKRNTSAEVVRILKDERVKREEELKERLQQLAQFELEHEELVFGTERDNNITIRKLERLQAALTEAQLATIESKSFYEALQTMADDPAGMRQFVDAQRTGGVSLGINDVVSLQAELQRLERSRADCLQRVKHDAPAIAALDAEMARVRAQIVELDKTFAESQLTVAKQQYLAAQEREKDLEAHCEQQRQAAVSLNNQLTQYALLQSDYDQTKKFCEILDDRIRVFNVDPQAGVLNVEIIEAAEPPNQPSHPQKAKTMALALCLGLFAGTGLALLYEWKDQRLRSTQEISSLLGLPILGAVPSMTRPKETVAIRGQKIRISPNSPEAEAFRTVRTAIFFGAPKDEAKTILFTSPAPGEGKSTIASNLAIAISQAGQRVLVIDADFRRPIQHRLFNLDRQAKGVSSVLAGQMDLTDAIEHSGLENLDVLTCGPSVPNPAEVINSESFARLLAELSRQYDRVIVDSPPIVAVTDALILTGLCDVTVLVLRAEKSMRRVSIQARDSLAGVDAHVLGVVVNDVPRKGDQYGYYRNYSYYGRDRTSGNGHLKAKKQEAKAKKEEITVNSRWFEGLRRKSYLHKLRAGLLPEAVVASSATR